MRIIKEGQIPDLPETIAICGLCNTEFAHTALDRKFIGMLGFRAANYEVNCPFCGKTKLIVMAKQLNDLQKQMKSEYNAVRNGK